MVQLAMMVPAVVSQVPRGSWRSHNMLRLHHLLVFVDEQLPFRLLVVLQELTVKRGTFINTRENWI
jgi:hypothetical protein